MVLIKDRVLFVGLLLALTALVCGLIAGATLAQESPTPDAVPTETPAPTPVIVEPPPPDPVEEEPGDPPATTPENLLGQIFALLKDGTFIVWAAAGVVLIVGLLKVFLRSAFGVTLEGNAAILLTLVIQVVVWLAYSIANYLGQGEAFKTIYLQAADVLRSLLPLAGSIFAGHVLYTQAKERGVPVLGYKPKAKTKPSAPSVPVASGGEGRDWTKP